MIFANNFSVKKPQNFWEKTAKNEVLIFVFVFIPICWTNKEAQAV